MLTGRTVTKVLKIESRQYDLMSFDLGEGIRRRLLGLGTLAFLAWVAITFPILNSAGLVASRPDVASLFILAPPIVLIMIGFLPDDKVPQRMRVTTFALRVRYIVSGHRPIIALGRREAARREKAPLRDRLFGVTSSREEGGIVQPVIRRDVRARLIGNEELTQMIRKGKKHEDR